MANLEDLKRDAMLSLSGFIDSLDPKRASILSYWLKDYIRFLGKESTFDPTKMVSCKRGSIVKVHLGYRIGSEEGGLHYAVVVDSCTPKSSPTVTVIPLTSVKPTTDLDHLHPSKLYLGDELYQCLQTKLAQATEEITITTTTLLNRLDAMEKEEIDVDINSPEGRARLAEKRTSIEALRKEFTNWKRRQTNISKMEDEISRMKRGSIALIGQITTISKIRVYDPIYPGDVLTKIRLSDESMDKIDEKVVTLFTGKNAKESPPKN